MRHLTGIWKWIVAIIITFAVCFIVFTSLWRPYHPALQGSVILSFAMLVIFLNFPISKNNMGKQRSNLMRLMLFGKDNSPSVLDLVFTVLGSAPCIFIILYWEPIVSNPLTYETYHLVLGAILFLMLIEATRRTLGYIVPIVVTLFILYALIGNLIPGYMGHAGYVLEELLYIFYLSTEGVWGLLTDLTSRLIAIFLLLGPILFACGAGSTFIKWARFTGGRIRGGAGHIALLSSAGLGMLSGSSVANVATTGTFTIPTMQKLGYEPEIAGATEASASSGGQIMPPIMGAGAFVMAELLGIKYTLIMAAAIIPAICYFVGIGSGIYALAGKYGLSKLPSQLIPEWRELLNPRELLNTIIPIGILIYLLVRYLPPQNCAAWALVSALLIFLFIGGSWKPREIGKRIKISLQAFYSASNRALVMLIVMMSCVQVIVTLINATGLGVKISEVIVNIAGDNAFIGLIAVMVVAIILGMGMSTTAAYVVAASTLGPALVMMGFVPLPSHLFIFYFAIAAGITPPVCVAVFTAKAISGGSWMRIAMISMGLSLGGYIIPYYFIYQPAILMQGGLWITLGILAAVIIAMFFIEVGVFGYLKRPVSWPERILFLAGGGFLIKFSPGTIIIGLVCLAFAIVSHLFMPDIPIIGKRPVQKPLVDLSNIKWDEKDTEKLLT
ncbi:MAG: TRAP transporter fused permease subunit [Desulfobacteraceae bacterium]|nr:TRAP transporter fused permease subunit [Desulfobacteraceae bacterium]